MAKPSTPSDFRFALGDLNEQNRALQSELDAANFELANSRREIERLKQKCLSLEDTVVDYKAEVGKWKTLAESKSDGMPHHPSADGELHKQLNVMRQQLATVTKEKNRYAEELKELRKITERPQPAGDQVLQTQVHNVQLELNRLRYINNQKDDEIRKILSDLEEQRSINNRQSSQLKSKEDEVDRLRKELLRTTTDLFNPMHQTHVGTSSFEVTRLRQENEVLRNDKQRISLEFQQIQERSVHLHQEIEALKSENYRLGNDHRRVSNDFQEMQEKNIHLHQQNMLYEEDYKRERDEKQLFERRWIAVKDENRTLQAVIDAVNQDRGAGLGGGGGVQPP